MLSAVYNLLPLNVVLNARSRRNLFPIFQGTLYFISIGLNAQPVLLSSGKALIKIV